MSDWIKTMDLEFRQPTGYSVEGGPIIGAELMGVVLCQREYRKMSGPAICQKTGQTYDVLMNWTEERWVPIKTIVRV